MKKHDYKVIDNTCVYGLEESIIASGYPMAKRINPCNLTNCHWSYVKFEYKLN